MTVCLDSWAVLAWLDGDEPAYGRVQAALLDRPVMSWINAVEVYYLTERIHGRLPAEEVLAELRATIDLELPGVSRMLETARLKAERSIALADCFAISTAAANHATLFTGDPEILKQTDLPCPMEDLRPRAE